MPGTQAIESIKAVIIGFMWVSSFSGFGRHRRGPNRRRLFFAGEALLPASI
jgi:hypothetical protein